MTKAAKGERAYFAEGFSFSWCGSEGAAGGADHITSIGRNRDFSQSAEDLPQDSRPSRV